MEAWKLNEIQCESEKVRKEAMDLYFRMCCEWSPYYGVYTMDRRVRTYATYEAYHAKLKRMSKDLSREPITISYTFEENETDLGVVTGMEYRDGVARVASVEIEDPLAYAIPLNETPV